MHFRGVGVGGGVGGWRCGMAVDIEERKEGRYVNGTGEWF